MLAVSSPLSLPPTLRELRIGRTPVTMSAVRAYVASATMSPHLRSLETVKHPPRLNEASEEAIAVAYATLGAACQARGIAMVDRAADD